MSDGTDSPDDRTRFKEHRTADHEILGEVSLQQLHFQHGDPVVVVETQKQKQYEIAVDYWAPRSAEQPLREALGPLLEEHKESAELE